MAATPDETLAEERQRSTRAGAAAIAAGVLTLAGSLLVVAASRDYPIAHLLDTLRSNLAQGDRAGPGPLQRVVEFFDDNIALVLAARIVPAIAIALTGYALVQLYRSTKARDPQAPKFPLVAAISGAVLTLVAAVAGSISLAIEVSDFTSSAQPTEEAARDVLRATFTIGALQLTGLGSAVVGVALIFSARNAMRIGLLTRFMGVLGMIVGALFLLPFLESSFPIVRIFWLIALGLLFLHKWPSGMPPAWTSGEARPWPTQQEIREQRVAAQAERGAGGLEEKVRRPRRERAEPPETPAPEPPPPGKVHSSSKKKKRKRR